MREAWERIALERRDQKVVKELRAVGGAHAALVTSAAKAAYDMAFPASGRAGRFLS